MTNDLTNKIPPLDSFETYEDSVEGQEQSSRGIIQGTCIKFTNESMWVTNAGEELSADLELVGIDVGRIVQKWRDQVPIESIFLESGQKFPDIEKMNEDTPREEWTEGPDGKPRGPWQAQHLVYLLNLATMDRFTFPTGTVGGRIAVHDLVDKTKMMRRFRGANVYPVVTLSDTFMNTRFGGRQRPDFIVKRWIELGPKEEVLPAPTEAALPAPQKVEPQQNSQQEVKPPQDGIVEPPSLAEEMGDEIPSSGSAGKSDHKQVGSRAPKVGATTKKRAGSRA